MLAPRRLSPCQMHTPNKPVNTSERQPHAQRARAQHTPDPLGKQLQCNHTGAAVQWAFNLTTCRRCWQQLPLVKKGLTTLSCWPHQEREAHHYWVHTLQQRPQQRLPALLLAVGWVPAAAAAVPC